MSDGGKKKTWVSDFSVIRGNEDQSPRMNFPWWKAPIYKDERIKQALKRREGK